MTTKKGTQEEDQKVSLGGVDETEIKDEDRTTNQEARKTLLPFLRPYRTRFILAGFGLILYTVLSLLPPLLLKYLLDEVVRPGMWELLGATVAAIVAIPLMAEVLRFANMWTVNYGARRFIADLRIAIYQKAFSLSLKYHGDNSTGATVQKIMDDANMLQRLLSGDFVRLVQDTIIFFFSITIMFSLSYQVGLILIVLIILYFLAYRFFARRIREATEAYRISYDQVAGRLEETISGVRQVRIYNREDWEHSLFVQREGEGLAKVLESRMGSVSLSTVCTTIAGFGSTVVAGLAALQVMRGELTYGDFAAIMAYVWYSIEPVTRLTNLAGQTAETFVSVRRIATLLREKQDIRSPENPVSLPGRAAGQVSFKDVHFSYEEDNPLYQGLSLDVEPGMTVALVGPTGCGKTTLTNLLMRYWDIQGGKISIDGIDVRTLAVPDLRSLFGVVLQDPVIFDGTLAENIAYSNREASRADIEEAARSAEIHELAVGLADGFDTIVGNEGVKLSVGEKQRVSIARAILRDPAILVMDEATSSLDSHSEHLIQKALGRVLKGRTSFIVAHRLSTITSADMIVVMNKGRIVEKGTHDELMATEGGLYRRLYEELLGEVRGVSA